MTAHDEATGSVERLSVGNWEPAGPPSNRNKRGAVSIENERSFLLLAFSRRLFGLGGNSKH